MHQSKKRFLKIGNIVLYTRYYYIDSSMRVIMYIVILAQSKTMKRNFCDSTCSEILKNL